MHKKVNIIIYSVIIILLLYLVVINIIDYYKIKEYSHFMNYLNSDINIKIYSNKIDENIFNEIENIYSEYDLLTSNKETDKHNLYYINNSNEEIIDVDSKLYEIIKLGKEYYDKSNGIININNGCLFNDGYFIINNECDTDINKIKLLDNNKIENNDFNINLNSIKLSYVNNIVSKYLKEKGYNDFIINTEGNTIVGDNYYDVGLQYNEFSVIDVVKLKNKSVVTKGTFNRNDYIMNDLSSSYLGIIVISDDNLLSNYLSIILNYKSIEEGSEILKKYNADGIWIDSNKNIYYSDNYLNYKNQ